MSDMVERLDGLRERASKVPGGFIYHQDRALWIGAIDDAWPGIARALRAADDAREDIEEARDDKLCDGFAELSEDRHMQEAGREASEAARRLSTFLNALDALKEAK